MANKRRKDSNRIALKTGESQSADGYYKFGKMINGKRYSLSATTLSELREKEKKLLDDIKNGVVVGRDANATLNKCFEAYMKTKMGLRSTTRALYWSTWRLYMQESALGKTPCKRITTSDIRTYFIDLMSGTEVISVDCNGKLIKKSVKPGIVIIRKLHGLISQSLELAIEDHLITQNPAARAMRGIAGIKGKRKAMTNAEEESFLKFVGESSVYNVYYPLFVFLLSTGCRIGEAFALQWSDVDREHNAINVEKSLSYKRLEGDSGYTFHMNQVKTAAGRRVIPLTPMARKALVKQRELDFATGKTMVRAEIAGYDNYIFRTSKGKPYTEAGIDLVLKRVVEAHNKKNVVQLPHLSAHTLRHSFCSRAAESGIPLKTLQTIMGHSDIKMTLDVYTDFDAAKIQNDVNAIAEKLVKVG